MNRLGSGGIVVKHDNFGSLRHDVFMHKEKGKIGTSEQSEIPIILGGSGTLRTFQQISGQSVDAVLVFLLLILPYSFISFGLGPV